MEHSAVEWSHVVAGRGAGDGGIMTTVAPVLHTPLHATMLTAPHHDDSVM